MADIFLTQDVKALLFKKKVVFLGDSNVRAFYKDLVLLSSQPSLLDHKVLRAKMEKTVFGDKLVKHGKKYNGRDFLEQREFSANGFNYSFYFITRVYNNYVEEVLGNITRNGFPDVIVINSCLWDMCRWGPRGVEEYRENLKKLMAKLKEIFEKDCLVIWLTTPPISQMIKGGFMVEQLEFLKYSLRFHVMEANQYARQVVVKYGFDVLDVHYHLRMQLHFRTADGIHWKAQAVRHVINLLLTHISLAFGVPLPQRYETIVIKRIMNMKEEEEDNDDIDIPPAKKRNVNETEKFQQVSKSSAVKLVPSTSHCSPASNNVLRDTKSKTQSVPSSSKSNKAVSTSSVQSSSSGDTTKFATFWSPAHNVRKDIKNPTQSLPSTSKSSETVSASSVQKSSNDPSSEDKTKFATFWSPASNGILKDIKNHTQSVPSTSNANETSSASSVQSSVNDSTARDKKKSTVQQQQAVANKKKVKNVPWPKYKSNSAKKRKWRQQKRQQQRQQQQRSYFPVSPQPPPFLPPYYQPNGTPNYGPYSHQGYNYGCIPNNIPQPSFNWTDMRSMQFGMWSPR